MKVKMKNDYYMFLFYEVIEKKNFKNDSKILGKFLKDKDFLKYHSNFYVKRLRNMETYNSLKDKLTENDLKSYRMRTMITTEKKFRNINTIGGTKSFNEILLDNTIRNIEL